MPILVPPEIKQEAKICINFIHLTVFALATERKLRIRPLTVFWGRFSNFQLLPFTCGYEINLREFIISAYNFFTYPCVISYILKLSLQKMLYQDANSIDKKKLMHLYLI
jgi:hypothetical protein